MCVQVADAADKLAGVRHFGGFSDVEAEVCREAGYGFTFACRWKNSGVSSRSAASPATMLDAKDIEWYGLLIRRHHQLLSNGAVLAAANDNFARHEIKGLGGVIHNHQLID